MDWETIYKKNRNRKFQEIQEITSNFILKTSLNNLSKITQRILIIGSITFLILLIIAFHSSIKAILSAILLFLLITIFSFYFNSYKIEVKKEKIIILANGQKINILVDKLKNIYLEENYYRIFSIKKKSYSLVILYETTKHEICDIKLTTSLLSREKLSKWFSTIILKPNKVNNEKKCIQYKRKRMLKKILFYGILMLFAFLIIIFHNIF